MSWSALCGPKYNSSQKAMQTPVLTYIFHQILNVQQALNDPPIKGGFAA